MPARAFVKSLLPPNPTHIILDRSKDLTRSLVRKDNLIREDCVDPKQPLTKAFAPALKFGYVQGMGHFRLVLVKLWTVKADFGLVFLLISRYSLVFSCLCISNFSTCLYMRFWYSEYVDLLHFFEYLSMTVDIFLMCM